LFRDALVLNYQGTLPAAQATAYIKYHSKIYKSTSFFKNFSVSLKHHKTHMDAAFRVHAFSTGIL
jgi:hypothetical protein